MSPLRCLAQESGVPAQTPRRLPPTDTMAAYFPWPSSESYRSTRSARSSQLDRGSIVGDRTAEVCAWPISITDHTGSACAGRAPDHGDRTAGYRGVGLRSKACGDPATGTEVTWRVVRRPSATWPITTLMLSCGAPYITSAHMLITPLLNVLSAGRVLCQPALCHRRVWRLWLGGLVLSAGPRSARFHPGSAASVACGSSSRAASAVRRSLAMVRACRSVAAWPSTAVRKGSRASL